MDKISPDALKRRSWHVFQSEAGSRGLRFFTPKIIAPLAVVALLLLLKAFWMAGIASTVTALIWISCSISDSFSDWLERALRTLAQWVGHTVATLLLAPIFFIVMPALRFINRLTGADPLLLRSSEAPTFWQPCDFESRRARYVRSMFCTERLTGARMSLLPLAVVFILLLVTAEVSLRIFGFGTPILYVQDSDVGYYPKPNQRVRAPGRIITINNHGMRAPDVPPQKAPGHIRILLLGDSTLAGTYVSNEELYSSLVEKQLNLAAGAPVFEVMNMGVNAWGPFHELAFVKKFGTFDADVAVICGPIYDAYRPKYAMERMPYFPATHPPRLALEQILYDLTWRFREKILGPPPWALGEQAELQLGMGMGAYYELAKVLQQHGAEVLVQMLPTSQGTLGIAPDTHSEQMLAQLNGHMAELGLKAECAGSIFKGASAKLYHDGVHFNRLGHQLYAAYFAERLIKNSSRVQRALPAYQVAF
jgi:hypothetical protein